MRKLSWSVLFSCLFLSGGCGYHLSAATVVAPAVVGKKIAISPFVNKGYRADLGVVLTAALVDEIASRSGGRVVSEQKADLLLKGMVVTYTTAPVAYSAADKVRVYRAVINAESTLTEKTTGVVVWKGVTSWNQDYPANADLALQQNSEDAAVRELCRRLAQQIYEKITTGF